MNISHYPTKVRVLVVLSIIIVAIITIGAGSIIQEEGASFWASQPPGTEILKEEGPGLGNEDPKTGVEVLKEEGPGLGRFGPRSAVELVKEEGPGLGIGDPQAGVQMVKEEGPGLPSEL